MKILSMTATFGKLVNQTLTLEPGMNVIHAPNEWGKSTWCAFLEAMLYGIDSSSRSKTGFLADKEHYAPWSGEPMSGRMEILWQGRHITIERSNKGRGLLSAVKAYETQTGLEVPELSVNNCGEVLLGVERSVFVRAGFLKQSQMPVTEDEKLRRRLNELVTTGDESGASDLLAQKLRDLKNRCRFNKKGLLPEAEAEKQELEQLLQQLGSLEFQADSIAQRQQQLKEQIRLLENHQAALDYSENLHYTQKIAAAQVARDTAARDLSQAEAQCNSLPDEQQLRQQLTRLQQLRDDRESLLLEAQMLPPMPEIPAAPEVFRGKDPEQAVKDAALDSKVLQQLQNDLNRPIPFIVSGVLYVLGLVLLVFKTSAVVGIAGILLLLLATCSLLAGIRKQKKLKNQINDLKLRYHGMPAAKWMEAAQTYGQAQQAYETELAARQQELAELNSRMEENQAALQSLTQGRSAAEFRQDCAEALRTHQNLGDLRRQYRQAEDVLQALAGSYKAVNPPAFADELTDSAQQTAAKLSNCRVEEQMLQRKLGQCQGQMHALGQKDALQARLVQADKRIEKLELWHRALMLAQQTQEAAARELQRRFAPRISQRAQELFGKLTGQRYQRLTLCQDLSLESAAQGETTLRSSLWRSDGTVDQLYLALRLAVSEELTPDAPVVLDDALVRFDDARMAAAMDVLKEESRQKQVILFTCQSREKDYWNKQEDSAI